jgi:tetratricopeptide (TPR) repeat protein
MALRWTFIFLLLIGLRANAGPASADALVGSAIPSIPDRPEQEVLVGVSEEWRPYLVQARMAERIADPLQRCLAFPDIPGNDWPKGHAAAHCRHHFAIRRPTIDDIAGQVERGEVGKLDALFDESLERHFSEEHFSDDIHDTFNYLLSSDVYAERVGPLTEAWLRQAPESAYANLARASYLRGAAGRARGGKYAFETPPENMRRMSELVEESLPYFERAVAINPRLVAAYTGMMDVARMDSRAGLEARARRAAEALDPACPELANQTMVSLQPRWGGSAEQMQQYADVLAGYVARRPHLAIHLAQPLADRGDRMMELQPVPREAFEILRAASALGSDEGVMRQTAAAAHEVLQGRDVDATRLVYLLQEARFRDVDAWASTTIGRMLSSAEPQWSLKYSMRALELEPDRARARVAAGMAYRSMALHDEAQRQFEMAMHDTAVRQESLRRLVELSLFRDSRGDAGLARKNAARAKPYLDMLRTEYPSDGRVAIFSFYQDVINNVVVDEADIRATLSKLDSDDPWQVQHGKRLEAMLVAPAPAEASP